MDENTASIICSVLGLVGTIVVAIITTHNHAEARRGADANEDTKREMAAMRKDMDLLEQKQDQTIKVLDANNLQTSRIDLRQALEHSRDDIPAILELARRYFVELHGDADLGPKFLYWVKEKHVLAWAQAHKTDIADIIECAKHPES